MFNSYFTRETLDISSVKSVHTHLKVDARTYTYIPEEKIGSTSIFQDSFSTFTYYYVYIYILYWQLVAFVH